MKQPTINLEDIKAKLIDKLRPSDWANRLKGFLLSSDFDKIIHYLYKEREEGRRFTPPLKTMFNAFEKCNYKDLKVVIIGQDPYHMLGISDGMTFSCSNTMIPQSELNYILNAVNKTVYDNSGEKEPNPDLTRWAEQGVLLLNTALSVQIGKSGTHSKIWYPFIAYLFDMLNTINSGLVFIYVGKKTLELDDLIDERKHYKLYTSHPASAGINNQAEWDCNDVFVQTNTILKGIINDEIKW